MQVAYKQGQEVVLKSGNGVPERLDGWRAVILEVTPGGKLQVSTGNEIRTVHATQVKRAFHGR